MTKPTKDDHDQGRGNDALNAALVPATTTAPPPSTASITTAVPGVVIDYGDFFDQFMSDAAPIAGAVAAAGYDFALHQIPMGVFVEKFIAPTTIGGYVSDMVTNLGGLEKGKTFTVENPGVIESMVLNAFVAGEPRLFEFLKEKVTPLISGLVGKVLGLPAPAAPAP